VNRGKSSDNLKITILPEFHKTEKESCKRRRKSGAAHQKREAQVTHEVNDHRSAVRAMRMVLPQSAQAEAKR